MRPITVLLLVIIFYHARPKCVGKKKKNDLTRLIFVNGIFAKRRVKTETLSNFRIRDHSRRESQFIVLFLYAHFPTNETTLFFFLYNRFFFRIIISRLKTQVIIADCFSVRDRNDRTLIRIYALCVCATQ